MESHGTRCQEGLWDNFILCYRRKVASLVNFVFIGIPSSLCFILCGSQRYYDEHERLKAKYFLEKEQERMEKERAIGKDVAAEADVPLSDTLSNDYETAVVPPAVSLSDIEAIPEPVVIKKVDLEPLMPVSELSINDWKYYRLFPIDVVLIFFLMSLCPW